MAKKSTATRQTNAARRSQTTDVAFVRAAKPSTSADGATPTTPTSAAPATDTERGATPSETSSRWASAAATTVIKPKPARRATAAPVYPQTEAGAGEATPKTATPEVETVENMVVRPATKQPAVENDAAPRATAQAGADDAKAESSKPSTPSARVGYAEKPRVMAATRAKPATQARPAAQRQQDARTQANRVARARATQQARTSNLISAERYGYVANDLKLILALAFLAFAVIVALTFVLPH